MKTHLFNVILMLALLGYIIFQSFSKYNDASIQMVLAANFAETMCIFIAAINFMALIKWSKFDVKYHTRITLILAFVGVVTLNSIIFSNANTDYLMIPLLLFSFLGFYFIAKRKKAFLKS
ncbi:MAG: hypothetical protein PF484_01060 [Bacteroidales bacterium]|jgi:hypothetical protein|nr:hypothetical protein [Bacteroidales bacterium]